MVYFTCNHCGESVKKPSVDKHYVTKCRSKPKSVSCMDCQSDFYAEEYVGHTSCITEAQKYSGKNYVPKESKFVGKKKQENWSETIRSILSENKYPLSQRERSLFTRLQQFENVPRKKVKFQNFIRNCLKINVNDANSIWSILEMELQKLHQSKIQESTTDDKKNSIQMEKSLGKSNDNLQDKTKEKQQRREDREPSAKKLKREVDHFNDKENNAQGVTNSNGHVIGNNENEVNELLVVLEKIVTKHTEGITIDKLKKKFLKKYKRKLQLDELTEKQDKKFQKKFRKLLKASAILQLDGDIVKVG